MSDLRQSLIDHIAPAGCGPMRRDAVIAWLRPTEFKSQGKTLILKAHPRTVVWLRNLRPDPLPGWLAAHGFSTLNVQSGGSK